MDRHFETFQRVYDARFQPEYGYRRPVVERSVRAFLRCGDLHEGLARIRLEAAWREAVFSPYLAEEKIAPEDEGDCVYRTTARRRDREDSSSLRAVGSVNGASPAAGNRLGL